MKRLLVASIALLATFTLAHVVRADVLQPEGEMPACEIPGITAPRDRAVSLESIVGVRVSAEPSRPNC